MLTVDAIQKRQAIKADPQFRQVARAWWDNRLLKDEHEGQDCMSKGSYIILNKALHLQLASNVTEEAAIATAEHDWSTDCDAQHGVMSYENFLDAMFELVDTWVDGTDANAHMVSGLQVQ
jgi:hypothetical protein